MAEPVKLSRDQLTLLRAIASEPNGILLEARHTTAASLVRKGLISRTPAPQEYSVHWCKNVNMFRCKALSSAAPFGDGHDCEISSGYCPICGKDDGTR